MGSSRRAVLSLAVAGTTLLGWASPALGAKQPPGDPPGNNGTIKIVATDPSDPDPGNEPQLDTCRLWLEFYGFDQGQVADVVFSAQPGTGTGELLRWTGTISDDPAGGGQDDDVVVAFNLASALQGYEAHPQQGYHVKVASNTQGAPGGAKQKVFWLKCAPEPPGSLVVTKATEGSAPAGAVYTVDLACNHAPLDRALPLRAGESATVDLVPPGTTCAVTESDRGAATGSRLTETPADDAPDGEVVVASGQATTVLVTNLFGGPEVAAAGASAPAGVAGATAARGPDELVAQAGTLPRTGAGPWGLTAAALVLVAGGGVARAASRRARRA